MFLADLAYQVLPLAITICYMYVCASVPLYTGDFLMHMFYVWHKYAHTSLDMPRKFWAYMPTLVGKFLSCTYLAITCEVVNVVVFLHIY